MQKFDSEFESLMKVIKDSCDDEDKGIYSQQQALLRKNELWYHGLQHVYWDSTFSDWVSPNTFSYPFGDTETKRGVDDYYDYILNIIKANGDSFIAALALTMQKVIFPPADVNNPNDIATAKAYNKISELIDIHNSVNFIWIYSLYLKWTQGVVGYYTYIDSNEKYGTYSVPKYESDDSGNLRITEINEQARNRVLIEPYGLINFKIPIYNKYERDISYLSLREDHDYTLLQEIFDDDEIHPSDGEGKYYRSPTSYTIGYESNQINNLTTLERIWIRPNRFRVIKKTSNKIYQQIRDKYPDGFKLTYAGKKLEAVDEEPLDQHWSLSRSGTTSHLISDPSCQSLLSIQDMKNTIANLSIDIIEHSIPEVFADTDVLNFDEYGKIESAPGFIFKAKHPPNMKSLGEGFYSLPKTQLTPTIGAFNSELDQEAQFLIGNNPSVWGGSMGNRVPGEEYSQARASSLQRWGLVRNELCDLWQRTKVQSVKLFVKNMADTESFTIKQGSQYLTTYINRHELTGQVGDVEPQKIDSFPMTAEEKRAWLMQLMKLNSQEITAILMHPSNRQELVQLFSFDGLHIPGSNQELKQLIEFGNLSQNFPKDNDTPSIIPDYDVDDHTLHAQVLRTILASETGIDLKKNKPEEYLNCILHLRLHIQAESQQMKKPYGSLPAGYPANTSAKSAQE